jgi:hypothetical protein
MNGLRAQLIYRLLFSTGKFFSPAHVRKDEAPTAAPNRQTKSLQPLMVKIRFVYI